MSRPPAEPGPRERLLVHFTGGLGDTLVAVPALRLLRRVYPQAEILVLHAGPGGFSPAELLLAPRLADRCLTYRAPGRGAGRLASAWSLWRRVRSAAPDVLVSLAHAERGAARLRRDRLFFRTCGVPRLLGFRGVDPACLLPRHADGRLQPVAHETCWRLERLERDGLALRHLWRAAGSVPLFEPPAVERAAARAWLAARRRFPARPLVAVAPGTPMPSKRWPWERFAELGAGLLADQAAELLVIGGRDEVPLAGRLLRAWGAGLDAAGVYGPLGSAALLEHCALLVGVDSGAAHLAAALGVPTVVVAGAQRAPGHWDPWGSGHRVLRLDVPCAGCRLAHCPVPGHPCLQGLDVETVRTAVMTSLAPCSPSGVAAP